MGNYSQCMHWLVEGFKYSYSDRMALGDPAFVDLSTIIPAMLSKDHAAQLRANLFSNQTFLPPHYVDLVQEQVQMPEDHGTTHMAIVDSQRNAVSITSTVNLSFGSKFVSPSTGVLLNNQMDDFSSPNQTNSFGYPPSKANFIAAGKRPLSSMTPTIVEKDSKLFMVVGGSGGSTIITGTTQVLLNVLSFGKDVMTAVSQPRLHDQLIPLPVNVESNMDPTVISKLQLVGNNVTVLAQGKTIGSAVQAIVVGDDGYLYAASDWRKQGQAAGY